MPFSKLATRKTNPLVLLVGPSLSMVMGLAFVLGDPARTTVPTFDAAKSIAPLHVWGIMFLVAAGLSFAALSTRSLFWLAVSLWIGGGLYLWWAACFAVQAVINPLASLNAWAAYGVIAFLHFLVAQRAWIGRLR